MNTGWDRYRLGRFCVLLLGFLFPQEIEAGLIWDASNSAGIQDGDGDWTFAAEAWNDASAGAGRFSYVSDSDIVFGGGSIPGAGSFNAKIGSPTDFSHPYSPVAKTITFSSGGNYTLLDPSNGQFNSLTLSGGNVTANVDATISLKVNAGSALNISGAGTLTLNGSEPVTADIVTVGAGNLLSQKTGQDQLKASELRLVNSASVVTLQGADEQIANTATVRISAGTLNLNSSPAERVQNLVVTGGTIQGNGALNVLSGGKFDIQGGAINSRLTGTAVLEKSGSGTATLTPNAQNDYTGGTTLTAGTLKAGNGGALPVNGTVRFNGGTLELNNQVIPTSGTLGVLMLQANSVLKLDAGGGAGVISFSSATRTGGILSIFNYAFGGDGADQVKVGSNPGTGFLPFVQFYSDEGVTALGQGALYGTGGTLSPDMSVVPEPTNVALVVFACGALVVSAYRKQRSP